TGNTLVSNVIAGNTGDGVFISGAGTSGNSLTGNSIGVNFAGAALGNDGNVVVITSTASSNTVRGSNIISSNSLDRVLLSTLTGNRVLNNFTGTDEGGSAMGNGVHGIDIPAAAASNGVGGNTIADNLNDGVLIDNADPAVTGNTIGGVGTGNVISKN